MAGTPQPPPKLIPPATSLLLFFFLLHLSATVADSQTPSEEKLTLLRIKNDLGNPAALQSWNNSGATPCNWTGVNCTGGAVAGLSLRELNIDGVPLPPPICELKNLSSLDLAGNGLLGPFPTFLSNCSNLRYLDLSNNLLPGAFPTSLYNSSKLEYVDLSQNLFVGVIPADVDRMPPGLWYLGLSANNFTGDIPATFGRLPAIQKLLLDNNLFTGSFPAELGNLSKLETLWLANNSFRPMSIPPEFGKMASLSYLWMSNAKLVGEIPDSFGNLAALEQLDISQNSLTGRIPAGIWMLGKLKYLYLYDNRLSGEINGTIGALELVEIDVSKNQLSGTIPAGFGALQNLSFLAMYYNNFAGEIPASIGLLPSLYELRLFSNNLTGVIPPELGKHSALWNVEVDNNRLVGELPDGLCAGGGFTSLIVFNNNLTGKLPASLGNCSTLNNFQVYNNHFTGDVPSGIWLAVNMTTVMLRNNALSGTLPDPLPWNLTRLDIANNQLSGKIPSSAGNLLVFLANNNLFSGELPTSLAGILRLQVLSLSGNRISGEIPAAISTLKSLTYLNLSSNQLVGGIPSSIGSLPVLNSLDLSNNQLSGNIPPDFGNLRLSTLNLSSNQLSGGIPINLQNQASDLSFLSNPGLCSYTPLTNVPTCGVVSKDSHRGLSMTAIVLLVVAAIVFSIIAVFGILLVHDYQRRRRGGDLAEWKLTSFHTVDFREGGILRGLTEDNVIGSGGGGKVYRVALGDRAGNVVAVKKIWSGRKLEAKVEKEFLSEVEILGSIRHANIVKLLCCVSGDDSKLLVYEYMEKGSLDRWLHSKRRTGEPLDWPTRLRIAIGAAQGLCYMHHDCSPPVVHRDVKSSNILLDSEFRARIADFGLARMLARPGEPSTISAVAGSFGYMAPECAYSSKVNEKVDVYSFGVVLLELVTGKEANDGGEHESLAEWAWRYFQDGNKVIDAVDKGIRSDAAYLHEIASVLKLGLFCTGTLPSTRPTMKEVLNILLRCGRLAAGEGEEKMFGEHDELPLLLRAPTGGRRKRSSTGSIAVVVDDDDETLACKV